MRPVRIIFLRPVDCGPTRDQLPRLLRHMQLRRNVIEPQPAQRHGLIVPQCPLAPAGRSNVAAGGGRSPTGTRGKRLIGRSRPGRGEGIVRFVARAHAPGDRESPPPLWGGIPFSFSYHGLAPVATFRRPFGTRKVSWRERRATRTWEITETWPRLMPTRRWKSGKLLELPGDSLALCVLA